MTESEFQERLKKLDAIEFREEFETELYRLYEQAGADDRKHLRETAAAGAFMKPRPWKNPTDYDRADLSLEQRVQQGMIRLSLHDGTGDYRDDLLTLAWCYNNLMHLSHDADAYLKRIADLSSEKIATAINQFVQRPPSEKDPESWGLKLNKRGDEFVFWP